MMSTTTLVIVITNFLLIAALPKIFFRRDGVFNLMWFVTGAPYFFSPLGVILTHMGVIDPFFTTSTAANEVIQSVSVLMSVISVGLMCFTIGTHRIPLSLWHQNNDAPKEIVTYGAYANIRHPFYTSFLIAVIGSAILAPSFVTFGSMLYGFFIMNYTAAAEEEKLSGSQFGQEYKEYIKQTGRFFPRLWGSK